MLDIQVKELQSTITDLQQKLCDAETMIDILIKDKDRKQNESMQRIASKIKVEYQDFQDTVNMQMSCDLGENLRLQLQNIFNILENSGIKFK